MAGEKHGSIKKSLLASLIIAEISILYLISAMIIGQVVFRGGEGPDATIPESPVTLIEPISANTFTIAEDNPLEYWWHVYFTNPSPEYDAADLSGTVSEQLVELIRGSKHTIHIAAFEFNLTPLAQALVDANARGVEVRWITDDVYGLGADDREGHGQFAMLAEAGIQIKDDHRSGLMHNKFVIIDEAIVWTGSTNLTVNGSFQNNNNAIVIRSPDLAQVFEREFDEMWEGKFGKTSPSTVNDQSLVVNGTPVQVLFAAEDGVANRLAGLIEKSASSVYFMAFSFTEDQMGQALLTRAEKGVKVQGIFETLGSLTQYSKLASFYCANIPVRQDGNPHMFHHKVMVIDELILVTGSFNYTKNANTRNDENVMIITNREIASQYIEEFERRWSEANPPTVDSIECP